MVEHRVSWIIFSTHTHTQSILSSVVGAAVPLINLELNGIKFAIVRSIDALFLTPLSPWRWTVMAAWQQHKSCGSTAILQPFRRTEQGHKPFPDWAKSGLCLTRHTRSPRLLTVTLSERQGLLHVTAWVHTLSEWTWLVVLQSVVWGFVKMFSSPSLEKWNRSTRTQICSKI